MTLHERLRAFRRTFAGNRAARRSVWMAEEGGRPVIYGRWLPGRNFERVNGYYGEFPPGVLARVMAFFPDIAARMEAEPSIVLHACCGSLKRGPYVRLDLNPAVEPDILGNVYDLAAGLQFELVIIDPPYSERDSIRYGVAPFNRWRAMRALAAVTKPGGFVVWLDLQWPQHRKEAWRTAARISVTLSTNRQLRDLSIFERRAS